VTIKKIRQRGIATVEFGLICMVLLPFLFALIDTAA